MLSLYVRFTNWIQEERGDFDLGGHGILGLILVLLLIACALVFLWVNIDINEK